MRPAATLRAERPPFVLTIQPASRAGLRESASRESSESHHLIRHREPSHVAKSAAAKPAIPERGGWRTLQANRERRGADAHSTSSRDHNSQPAALFDRQIVRVRNPAHLFRSLSKSLRAALPFVRFFWLDRWTLK